MDLREAHREGFRKGKRVGYQQALREVGNLARQKRENRS